ncbi:30S ribosomal protein S1 [compost metagenome]
MEVVVLEIDRENRRISLGHKQLEENPWDVFETIFGEGSVHQGTIIETKDKAGIVALPYGVEGICPSKHLRKEDGSNAKVEETLDFKVIEFNKESKKIVVSHTRTFEEGTDEKTAKPAAGKKGAAGAGSSTSQAVKAINQSNAKSTLGDLDALAALKEKMEGGE